MYHVYKQGYSVLPMLKKISIEEVFQKTPDYDHYILAKKDALKTQTCFFEHNIKPITYQAVCEFIVKNYKWTLKKPYTFTNIATQLQDDLAIQIMDDNKDWLAAAHICFPSGWLPRDKIGKPLQEIHAPIPGMNLKNSRKLVETMTQLGPFERFVWGVKFSSDINGHPNRPQAKFDSKNPAIWIKVERQVTVPFPEHNAGLFILRQFIISEPDIDKPALLKSLLDMSEEERKYKNIDYCFDDLVLHLSK
jgi:hypothetical protein